MEIDFLIEFNKKNINLKRGSDPLVSLLILMRKASIWSQVKTRPFPSGFHVEKYPFGARFRLVRFFIDFIKKHAFGAGFRLVNFLIEFNQKSIGLEGGSD